MRRTNDMPITNSSALYDDGTARAGILGQGWIATGPGGLAEAERAVQRNDVYNTQLRLIFYDEPIFGHYQERFDKIFNDSRYTDIASNARHFAAIYATILANRPPSKNSVSTNADDRTNFDVKYYHMIAGEKAKLDEATRLLSPVPGQRS
jgi:hypothetical protein